MFERGHDGILLGLHGFHNGLTVFAVRGRRFFKGTSLRVVGCGLLNLSVVAAGRFFILLFGARATLDLRVLFGLPRGTRSGDLCLFSKLLFLATR